MAKVAFLGLGVMGYPMAGHLAAAGHAVTVYNRTGTVAGRRVIRVRAAARSPPPWARKAAALRRQPRQRSEQLQYGNRFAGLRSGTGTFGIRPSFHSLDT